MQALNTTTARESQPGDSPFSPWQLQKLAIPPAPEEYWQREDGQYYLPLGYYQRMADQIFGAGNWGVFHDATTLKWQTHCHPLTDKVIGVECCISTTLTIRDCIPITVTGHAPVQFVKDGDELAENQQISVFELARRGAEAKGFKKALSYLGRAFEGDYQTFGSLKNSSTATPPIITEPKSSQPPETPVPAEGEVIESSQSNSSSIQAGKSENPPLEQEREQEQLPRLHLVSGSGGTTRRTSLKKSHISAPSPAPGETNTEAEVEAAPSQPGEKDRFDPWEEKTRRDLVQSTSQALPSKAEEIGVVAHITPEQLSTIERMVVEKGYPMKAADGTALKLFGVSVAELTGEQASEMITRLQRLKPRVAA